MKVEIISKELIKPSSPTPPNLRIYKLSSLDQILPPSFVPLILYYSYDQEPTNITPSHMSIQLKKSLTETLTRFYPLAGRLTEDRRFIDCSDQGVYYAEARVDFHLLSILESPKIEELSEFIPCKLADHEFGYQIVEEQLAIQVNLFQCGGIAIGLCISHRIADAFSFCTFIKAWANTTKGDGNSVLPLPVYNSASLFPPQNLRPDHGPKPRISAAQPQRPPRPKLVTRMFAFTASTIAALKAEVVNNSAGLQNPTRVEVVTALIWKCAMAVPELSKLGKSVAFHIVNLRGRMMVLPPLMEEHSFGNFFQVAGTSPVTNEEAADLSCLTGKLRSAFREITDGVHTRILLGENSQQLVSDNIRRSGLLLSQGDVEIFNFSSWCRFPSYEADFGWGKPSWVSSVHFGGRNGIFLFDSIKGGIEVWVTMNEQDMIEFEKSPELQSFIIPFPG